MADFISWAVADEYFLSWCIYLLGALACLFVLWRMTATWPIWLCRAVRLLGAVLILPPAKVTEEAYFLAPAFIVAPFDWFSYGPERAEPAISVLLLSLLIAAVVYVLTPLIVKLMARKKA